MKIYILVDNGHFPVCAYKIEENAHAEANKLNRERYLAVIENQIEFAKSHGSNATREDIIKEIDGWYDWNTHSVIEVNLEE